MNLEYEFRYDDGPSVSFLVVGTESGLAMQADALIDTGADVTVLDSEIAKEIGLDLEALPQVGFRGVTGGSVPARIGEIELLLLSKPELSTIVDVLFVDDFSHVVGNLIGLDILSRFDIALSHNQRLGYIGRVEL